MPDSPAPPVDVDEVIRGRDFQKLLVLSALVGFVVSLAAWAFLSLVPWIQDTVYLDLPSGLGFDTTPWWWPIPVLAVAGIITAFAITRLPGGGGGVPAEGLSAGTTEPIDLPGVLLAALATLGLGLVLGPSSPVIALGMGVGLLVVRFAKRDAPDQVRSVLAAAGAFAALAVVFSNPIIAAIILIEAIGIGGSMAPLIVLPGLIAAGVGSLVYLGLGQLTGLSTSAYALKPLEVEPLGELTVADFGWTMVIAVVAALVGFSVVTIGRAFERTTRRKYLVLVPLAGVIVGVLAVVFAQVTDQTEFLILFSGSRALDPMVSSAATFSVATLAMLVVCKGLAWGVSMGSFRGGPVFPAIFLGAAGGLLASHLPGFSEGAAVPVAVAATVVAVLRLPLASAVIALVMTAQAGPTALPLIIVAVVISYVLVDKLHGMEKKEKVEGVSSP